MLKSAPLILNASEMQPDIFSPCAITANQANIPNTSTCKGSLFSSHQLLVFVAVGGELAVIVRPLELQRPAPFSKAGENEAVSFQVNLGQAWLGLKVWRNIICNIPRGGEGEKALSKQENTPSDQTIS